MKYWSDFIVLAIITLFAALLLIRMVLTIFTILLVSVPNLESSETETKSAKTLTKLMLVKSIIMNRADDVVTIFVSTFRVTKLPIWDLSTPWKVHDSSHSGGTANLPKYRKY
jgi:NADH:ubiquinone oxidoreductase subunit 2 (subunit N)